MQSAIDECLSGRRFDVVHVETSPMCGFDYGTDVPVVVDEQNLESELMQRMAGASAPLAAAPSTPWRPPSTGGSRPSRGGRPPASP